MAAWSATHGGIFILEYQLKFISLCSGIEAASVAFEPLGWQAVAFAEIEPFPCAVLAHHYPNVPNFGDMTKFREWPISVFIEADAVVGGPPCQAFSVAGLRRGLSDARGNLTLVYAELINYADQVRKQHGKQPVIVLYENVPGLLSDKTGAFGSLLGALAGEDDALVPPGGKWTDAGCVFGPERAIAWRVFDAQYFLVSQRRRRVFVVASARDGFDPCEVLFEFDGVRRDIAPSREAGQEVAGTLASRTNGGGFPGSDEAAAGYVQPVGGLQRPDLAFGGNNQSGPIDVATARNACSSSSSGRLDFESETFVVRSVALRGRDGGATAELGDEVAGCLRASGGGGDKAHVLAPVELTPTLTSNGDAHSGFRDEHGLAVCITGETTHTLKAEGFDASEDGTGRGQPIVTAARDIAQCITGNYGKQADNSDTALGPNVAIHGMAVRRLTPVECERLQAFPDAYTLIPWRKKPAADCPDGPRYKALGNSMCVNNMRWIGERIEQHLTHPFGDLI